MAANRIKGITVEIGGDTTKLQTALKGVNSEIRNTQTQLKDVEKLLKLDPGNTELLAQKHRLLADAVEETKSKLETLKSAAEQAETALEKGAITQDQYDALQREIVETEQNLRRLEEQANQSATALQKISATGEKLQTLGNNISTVGEKLLPVTGAVAGLGTVAVKTAADFDAAMSKVAAVSGATGADFDALRDKAREMGAKTKFSASEAAEAMNYMAMAGWKTSDMLAGIEGIMNLAAASGEDLATTSDIVTDALTAFGLTAADSGHFADILAAASSNANTNVSMMGETFKYCAPIAGALGFSAEDTAEAIGLMANAGIKSSQAGTSLRTIMSNLTGEVKISGEAIGEVVVATTKADGSMRELSDIIADCRTAFAGLSESEKAQAAEALVGKTAMSGFLALVNAAPSDIEKLSSAIANCDGSAEGMAATMQDNLAGQFTILKSQLQELAISFGEILMPAIRQIVTWIQGFVDKLNGMDEGTKKVVTTVALFVAALGPVLIIIGKVISAVGTIMTIIPKIAGVINVVKTAFAALNTTMLANPIFLIIAAITALVVAFIYLWNNCDGFREFWINLWEIVKDAAVTAWNAIKSFFAEVWEAIKNIFFTVFEAIKMLVTTYFEIYRIIIETVFNVIETVITTVWEAVKGIFTTVLGVIQTIVMTHFNIYKTIIETVMTIIKTVITTVWETIKTVVTTVLDAIKTIFTTVWDAIKTIISAALSGIKGLITGDFTAVKESITIIMNTIKSTIGTVWNTIRNTVSTVLNAIKSAVSNIFNGIVSAIKGAMTNVLNAVKNGFSNVKSHITGLASQAVTWGKDLVMGIVNGIKSCIGAVGDAVKSVADKIKAFLHFSVPDEGPLTDYESWMPDFMGGLAEGIKRSRGMVADAVKGVAEDMVVSPTVSAGSIQTYQNTQTDTLTGILNGIQNVLGSIQQMQPVGGDISIPVYIGGTLIDELVVNAQNRQNLRSGGR
ncbi:MAG: phage tail tape measure protein [Lachnospiraceae bacterium]|nr:phage tail tape measure protein [Lachnospiraceae bacterium]